MSSFLARFQDRAHIIGRTGDVQRIGGSGSSPNNSNSAIGGGASGARGTRVRSTTTSTSQASASSTTTGGGVAYGRRATVNSNTGNTGSMNNRRNVPPGTASSIGSSGGGGGGGDHHNNGVAGVTYSTNSTPLSSARSHSNQYAAPPTATVDDNIMEYNIEEDNDNDSSNVELVWHALDVIYYASQAFVSVTHPFAVCSDRILNHPIHRWDHLILIIHHHIASHQHHHYRYLLLQEQLYKRP
jgi:hypothetical protein